VNDRHSGIHPTSAHDKIRRIMSDTQISQCGTKPALSADYEMFAGLVASGHSQSEAAEIAGFARSYSSQIARRPDVQTRIAYLRASQIAETEEFGGIATRAWIEAQLVVIITAAMQDRDATMYPPEEIDGKILPARVRREGKEPDHDLARRTLMDLARLKGMIVEKRESKSMAINGILPAGAMKAHLAQYLDALEPGARTAIERRMAALEARKGKPALGRPPKVLESAPAHGST
jgi:hypothetical protein